MTDYPIISNASFPPTVPGPKRGSLRFDNRQVIHEAAVGVITGHYKNATEAAQSLKDQYRSCGTLQSKITMFVRKIKVEIAKIKSNTMSNIQS
jgi:hypothetical protein